MSVGQLTQRLPHSPAKHRCLQIEGDVGGLALAGEALIELLAEGTERTPDRARTDPTRRAPRKCSWRRPRSLATSVNRPSGLSSSLYAMATPLPPRDQAELLEDRDAIVEAELLGDHAVDDLDHRDAGELHALARAGGQ